MLRDRPIALVTAARFIARLGGEAAFFIGIWGMAAYRFHATPSQLAVVMASLAVFSMIGSAVSGVLIDRYGPRNVLIGAQMLYVPVALGVTLIRDLPTLVIACTIFGAVTAPIMTATSAFAPYLTVDEASMGTVNALLEGAGAASFVLGPGLGAIFARAFGLESVFYLDAALTTIGVLLVLPVKTPPLPSKRDKHPLLELASGVRITYSIAPVRYYVLMGTLMWFSFGAFGALEPLFYRDVVKTGIETIGWMNSLFGLGIALGAWVLTRLPRRFTSARALAAGVGGMGLGAVLYVGTTHLGVIALGAVAWGAMIGATEPLLRTLMQLDAPEEYVGRVMGTSQVHRSAGELVPLAIAPSLAALFGVQAVMIGGGLLASVIALSTLAYARRLDAQGRRPHRGITMSDALMKDEPITPLT